VGSHAPAADERAARPAREVRAQPGLSTALAIQSPSVTVSRPTDPDEQDAERIADALSGNCPGCQGSRPCETCANAGDVRRAAWSDGTDSGGSAEAPAGGRALDTGTRASLEPRLGVSLGGVRVHTDGSTADTARQLRARAFTIGSHIGFGAGEYAPETAGGRRLLAHELAHVVQQPSDQVHTPSHRPPRIQRKPDEGGDSGESSDFDPERERDAQLSALDFLISLGDSEAKAYNLRLKLLLHASNPDWPDRAALDKFYEECTKTAEREDRTIAALGDPDRTDPEAFPGIWSERLNKHLMISYPLSQMQRDSEAAWGDLEKLGGGITKEIFDHGLPLSFGASLGLRAFQLYSILGLSFQWGATPAGDVVVEAGPLATFITYAGRYLSAVNEADLINTWIEQAQSVVRQVEHGELSIDPEAFDRYEEKRPLGVPPEEIKNPTSTAIPELGGRIDPATAERLVTSLAGWVAFGRSYLHGKDVAALASRFIGQADAGIAGEDPILRQLRAGRWGHERGFYLDAVKNELEDIKEHAVEIGVGMAEDVGKFAIIQFIPVVNVIADIYLGLQLISDVADTLGDLASADEEARNAKTAAELQRAAAHQAAAVSSAARKVATVIFMHKASKVAGKVAEKAHDWATRGEKTEAGPERAGGSEDPAKVQERAKQKRAEQTETKRQAAEVVPGEKARADATAPAARPVDERVSLHHGTDQTGYEGLGSLDKGRIDVTHASGGHQDLGQGFYLALDGETAAVYAMRRGGQRGGGRQHVLTFEVPASDLGIIVDIRPGGNFRAEWEAFLQAPPDFPGSKQIPGFETNRALLARAPENRGTIFEHFLEKVGMKTAETIFAPLGDDVFTGIVNPAGPTTQVCVRSQRVADRLNQQIRTGR
jgi:hypothetical protein